MIQDIKPYKLNNRYTQIKASSNDFVMIFSEGKILVEDTEEVMFPKVKDIGEDREYIYLFSISEFKYFMVSLDDLNDCVFPQNYHFAGLRDLNKVPQYNVFAAYTAKHLTDWYRDTRFCGRCGNKMSHSLKERAMVCSCGYTAYPRIMPAVIVGVTNKDSMLLTKYRTGYGHNALIAGFVEIGETIEETVHREVMEEAGIKVKNLRYYKSQPWGIPNDILVGYFCEVDGNTDIHMDDKELKYAEWVKREDIILQPNNYSLTNEMMRLFKENKDGGVAMNMNFANFKEETKKKGLGSVQYTFVNGDPVYLSRGIREIYLNDSNGEQTLIEYIKRFQDGDYGNASEYGKEQRSGHEYGRYEISVFEPDAEEDTAVWVHRAEDAIMVFFKFER